MLPNSVVTHVEAMEVFMDDEAVGIGTSNMDKRVRPAVAAGETNARTIVAFQGGSASVEANRSTTATEDAGTAVSSLICATVQEVQTVQMVETLDNDFFIWKKNVTLATSGNIRRFENEHTVPMVETYDCDF